MGRLSASHHIRLYGPQGHCAETRPRDWHRACCVRPHDYPQRPCLPGRKEYRSFAVSVQAMSWALSLPVQTLKDSSARHVLLCLANYAGSNGTGAFPSASTLAQDTGLSERTVRYKLDDLEQSGLIKKGNQAIAAVHIERHDRRPVVYDLQILRGANPAPRTKRGADDATGCNAQQNGVQPGTERGAAAAPNPPLNHQGTEEQLQQREIDAALAEQNSA